jgi:hypothetical protein
VGVLANERGQHLHDGGMVPIRIAGNTLQGINTSDANTHVTRAKVFDGLAITIGDLTFPRHFESLHSDGPRIPEACNRNSDRATKANNAHATGDQRSLNRRIHYRSILVRPSLVFRSGSLFLSDFDEQLIRLTLVVQQLQMIRPPARQRRVPQPTRQPGPVTMSSYAPVVRIEGVI